MTVTIPHNLPKEEAESRVQKILGNVKSQFGNMVTDLQEDWQGNKGNFKFSMSGHAVSGSILLLDSSVQVDIVLPFIANLFKGKIQSVIEEQGAKILS